MERIAFKMKLHRGQAEEYKRRHDLLWPELKALLHNTGIQGYSIFLDEDTSLLFGIFSVDDPALLDQLADQPVMQKWWQYMKDIMETNNDGSPASISLKEVFYLP